MKKTIFYFSAFVFLSTTIHAQGLKGLMKKATAKDSLGQTTGVGNLLSKATSSGSLSNDDIIAGLKEALSVGTRHYHQGWYWHFKRRRFCCNRLFKRKNNSFTHGSIPAHH
jgi:hypothetical protein